MNDLTLLEDGRMIMRELEDSTAINIKHEELIHIISTICEETLL